MLLQLSGIKKEYRTGGKKRWILDGIDLSLEKGQIVSVTGRSGCGKTTLLNIIAGLAKPNSGTVTISGKTVSGFTDLASSRRRNRDIGLVYQTFNLLNNETVLSNILLPARISGNLGREVRDYADELMADLMIYKFRKSKAAILSGGQKQRVAIARALINRPDIILADEPTANLDRRTSLEIFEVLGKLREKGRGIIVVTHKEYMHEHSDRVCILDQGKLRDVI